MKTKNPTNESAIDNRQSGISWRPRVFRPLRCLPLLLASAISALADGVPEPGLVMYGLISDTTSMNPATSGTITWTVTPVGGGAPVTVSAALTNIGGQYSYRLRVPFETLVGSTTLSANTLAVNAAPTTYNRALVFINGTNAATLVNSAQSTFGFKFADRGVVERVDLLVTLPAQQTSGGIPAGSGGTNTVTTGTNSLLAAKFISIRQQVDGSTELRWTGSTNASYRLLRSTDPTFAAGSTPIGSNLPALQPCTIVVDTNTSGAGPYFYRLQTQ